MNQQFYPVLKNEKGKITYHKTVPNAALDSALRTGFITFGTFLYSTTACYAASDFFTSLKSSLSTIYGKVAGITTIIALLAIVCCMLMSMVNASDEQEARAWRKRAKSVAWAWVVINVLGAILTTANSLLDGMGVDTSDL